MDGLGRRVLRGRGLCVGLGLFNLHLSVSLSEGLAGLGLRIGVLQRSSLGLLRWLRNVGLGGSHLEESGLGLGLGWICFGNSGIGRGRFSLNVLWCGFLGVGLSHGLGLRVHLLLLVWLNEGLVCLCLGIGVLQGDGLGGLVNSGVGFRVSRVELLRLRLNLLGVGLVDGRLDLSNLLYKRRGVWLDGVGRRGVWLDRLYLLFLCGVLESFVLLRVWVGVFQRQGNGWQLSHRGGVGRVDGVKGITVRRRCGLNLLGLYCGLLGGGRLSFHRVLLLLGSGLGDGLLLCLGLGELSINLG